MSERLAIRYGKKGPNRNRHQRVELETAVTPGMKRINLQVSQDDTAYGILKESTRDVHRVTANEDLDTVEGPTSSEAEKDSAHGAGDGDVEAPVSITKKKTFELTATYRGVARDEQTSKR
jgi:hypothetical protein